MLGRQSRAGKTATERADVHSKPRAKRRQDSWPLASWPLVAVTAVVCGGNHVVHLMPSASLARWNEQRRGEKSRRHVSPCPFQTSRTWKQTCNRQEAVASVRFVVLSCFFRVHTLGGVFLAHAEAGLHCTVQSITSPWSECSGPMPLNHLGALCGSYTCIARL